MSIDVEKVKLTKTGAKVFAKRGYRDNVSLLARIKDSKNGFICYFPSYNSMHQDSYLCLDYAEAEYVRLALNALHEKEKNT